MFRRVFHALFYMFRRVFYALFQYELIFSLQDEHDAARMIVQSLIDKYPKVDTKTFIGMTLFLPVTFALSFSISSFKI